MKNPCLMEVLFACSTVVLIKLDPEDFVKLEDSPSIELLLIMSKSRSRSSQEDV